MKIKNPTLAIGVRADGSARFVIHHGGTTMTMELSDEERAVVHAASAPPKHGPARSGAAARGSDNDCVA